MPTITDRDERSRRRVRPRRSSACSVKVPYQTTVAIEFRHDGDLRRIRAIFVDQDKASAILVGAWR